MNNFTNYRFRFQIKKKAEARSILCPSPQPSLAIKLLLPLFPYDFLAVVFAPIVHHAQHRHQAFAVSR